MYYSSVMHCTVSLNCAVDSCCRAVPGAASCAVFRWWRRDGGRGRRLVMEGQVLEGQQGRGRLEEGN